jgi:hypothetical protein
MIVSIHQLHYLPWLRYFDKIARADVFVVLDNIQFTKNGFQNRNKIKTSSGWIYLTIPVKAHLKQNLNEILIDNIQRWREKHCRAFITNYSKAKYFKNYIGFFEEVYKKNFERLNEINYEILFFLLDVLKIKTKILKSSELNISGESTERLINICKKLKADTYLSGDYAGGVYLDLSSFEKENIKVIFQRWICPEYNQLFKKAGFVPDLSIVDLIFNCGEESLNILLKRKLK